MSKVNEVNKAIEDIINSDFTIRTSRKLDLSFKGCNIILDFDDKYLKDLSNEDMLTLIKNIDLPKIIAEQKDIHLMIKENSVVPLAK